VQEYRKLQQRTGTERVVLVTPSTYGSDNACMLQGLAALGADARGVAVISGKESDDALQQLHAAGVRGVRVNLSLGGGPQLEALPRLAARIAPLRWHLQLLMPPERLVECEQVLLQLPVDVVFDHFARIPPQQVGSDAHRLVLRLLDTGRAWVKLSGGYIVSAQHSVADPALDALARSYLFAARERIVWGSDWPHATASAGVQPMPDDAQQVDRLAEWAGSDAVLRQILVTNPEALYGFPP
jgi:predicted TIM-barrel fold metal-dependent hydrolase